MGTVAPAPTPAPLLWTPSKPEEGLGLQRSQGKNREVRVPPTPPLDASKTESVPIKPPPLLKLKDPTAGELGATGRGAATRRPGNRTLQNQLPGIWALSQSFAGGPANELCDPDPEQLTQLSGLCFHLSEKWGGSPAPPQSITKPHQLHPSVSLFASPPPLPPVWPGPSPTSILAPSPKPTSTG